MKSDGFSGQVFQIRFLHKQNTFHYISYQNVEIKSTRNIGIEQVPQQLNLFTLVVVGGLELQNQRLRAELVAL